MTCILPPRNLECHSQASGVSVTSQERLVTELISRRATQATRRQRGAWEEEHVHPRAVAPRPFLALPLQPRGIPSLADALVTVVNRNFNIGLLTARAGRHQGSGGGGSGRGDDDAEGLTIHSPLTRKD
ncbi:unnamed protein product [Spodoptera exigua]|nr:unnamed protein product [Spodoptera exigua]